MPSEQRLHPLSILFAFIAQIRALVIPGVLLLVGASSRGAGWEAWMLLLVIPAAAVATLRYVTFRYRYEQNEMVIRSGLVFKKERHIPYARIQNVDAVQRLLHRMLNVVEVRLQTGGGDEPEATMSVLPLAAFEDMRQRVSAARHAATGAQGARGAESAKGAEGARGAEGAAGAESAAGARGAEGTAAIPVAQTAETLLHLDTRELLLCGFIDNRGAVVIAAGMGLVWELGLFDRMLTGAFGPEISGRGAMRELLRNVVTAAEVSAERVGFIFAACAVLLLVVRVLSMGWAAMRLHGFTLRLENDDLRSEYGLLTHVTATIPLRRIQTLTVHETPLHRVCGRVAVRVESAGGPAKEGGGTDREWLAPILGHAALPAFVRRVLPGTEIDAVAWQRVASGAFKRELKGWLIPAGLVCAGAFWIVDWWALTALPLLLVWALVGARQTVKHLGWAVTDDAVLFRRGWLWRRVTVVRFAKIQTVTFAQTPFDRRMVMARLRVDTAGASDAAGRVNIPYLTRETAGALFTDLSAQAANTQFKW